MRHISKRKARQQLIENTIGIALITVSLAGFAGLVWLAYAEQVGII